MRHRKSGRKLNRNSSHRKALMKNLAIAFIERELIKTTVPNAKELRGFVEPLKDRPGGYLRIIKAGFRPGDKADMAYVEWVDRTIDADASSIEPELKSDSAA